MKKHSYKDDFEMVYLRHEYLSKIKKYDPKWVDQNRPVVVITATKMYHKLKPNFDMVGFDVDDLISITNVYMLAYMGLYSLTSNQKLRDRFIERYKARTSEEPLEKDFTRTERNNLINFLRQRLQHCAKICERKSRNIKVGREKRGIFAKTLDSKAVSDDAIIRDHKKMGYRKVTQKEFKEAKIKCRLEGLPEIVDKDGFKMLEIQILSNGIDKEDYKLLVENEYRNIYNETPEEMIVDYENTKEMAANKNKFKGLSNKEKLDTLYIFVEDHKGSPKFKVELKQARKMIETLKTMV